MTPEIDAAEIQRWAKERRKGAWRFIALAGLRNSLIGGVIFTVLPLIGAADFCWREGQTIDCGLFVIPGQAGGQVFPIFRHLVNIFPIMLVFNLVFFLLAHVRAWWVLESAYRDIETNHPELLTQALPHPGDAPTLLKWAARVAFVTSVIVAMIAGVPFWFALIFSGILAGGVDTMCRSIFEERWLQSPRTQPAVDFAGSTAMRAFYFCFGALITAGAIVLMSAFRF